MIVKEDLQTHTYTYTDTHGKILQTHTYTYTDTHGKILDYQLASSRIRMMLPKWCNGKESTCQCRRHNVGSIPRLGRSPGEGHGNPLQCSCLKNSMD